MRSAIGRAWYFASRSAPLGAVAGAAAGATCGAATLLASMVAGLVAGGPAGYSNPVGAVAWALGSALLFGAKGALVGLFLGVCGGLLAALLTQVTGAEPGDAQKFAEVVGRVYAVTSVVALLADWLISGFPEPYSFVLTRPAPSPPGGVTVVGLLWLVLVPTLLFSFAMRWVGRKVAGWYVRRSPSPEGGSPRSARS